MSYRREHTESVALESTAGRAVRVVGPTRLESGDSGRPRIRAARRPVTRATSARTLVSAAVAIHLIASSALYMRLVRELYALLEDTPRLVVLERGLVRLLAASVFLPPAAPSVLLVGTALWVGAARREPRVARMLAYGALALSGDSVLRFVGVWLAPPVANIGPLLDLPARFSPGPRMFAELAGLDVTGSGLLYWSVVCSLAATIVVICVARALLLAERASLEPAELRRRDARGDPIAALQCATVSVLAFAGIAFAGQVALPPATQLFLQTFG